MEMLRNKKFFDIHVVRSIIAIVLYKAINENINVDEVELFLDDNFNDIMEEVINRNE